MIQDTLLNILLILCIIFVSLVVIIAICNIISDLFKKNKTEEDNDKNEVIIDTDFLEDTDKIVVDTLLAEKSLDKCNELLDSIIRMHINNYKVLTGFTIDSYITRETKDEMVTYVSEMVKTNLTSYVLLVLSMFYIIDTKDQLDKLIDLRIKLNILADMVEQNAPIE